MKEKLGQDPAFPSTTDDMITTVHMNNFYPLGMSKRFYAACAAMQGLVANADSYRIGYFSDSRLVKQAYLLSDELLKQEYE